MQLHDVVAVELFDHVRDAFVIENKTARHPGELAVCVHRPHGFRRSTARDYYLLTRAEQHFGGRAPLGGGMTCWWRSGAAVVAVLGGLAGQHRYLAFRHGDYDSLTRLLYAELGSDGAHLRRLGADHEGARRVFGHAEQRAAAFERDVTLTL